MSVRRGRTRAELLAAYVEACLRDGAVSPLDLSRPAEAARKLARAVADDLEAAAASLGASALREVASAAATFAAKVARRATGK